MQGNCRLGTTTLVYLTKNRLLASDSRDDFQGGCTSLLLPPGAENPSYATVLGHCLSVCLPVSLVCDVGLLWPNGWTDEEETWHAGRPRPWPHCVRWGPSSPSPIRGQSPQFLAHVCCAQAAAWIKMPLRTKVGLGPGHVVLHGDPAAVPKGA